VQFSNGGQFFAAVNGSNNNQNIQIFDTYTGEIKYTLKGHNGRVRHLLWSKDDRYIASCGADGMIYAWQIGSDF
jgi:WD40 repeat protein